MGRQLRSLRRGEMRSLVPARSTGTAVVHVPNYGVTYITNSSAESYVLDAPEEGSEKTFLISAAASTVTVIRGNTAGAQTVSFNTTGGNTILTAGSTVDRCIQLVGINATQWFITNTRPGNLAINSTGIVGSTT
jgi:hypothetical protein